MRGQEASTISSLDSAGKPDVPRLPGHSFFTQLLGYQTGIRPRQERQLAAQIAMLFLAQLESRNTPDLNAKSINDFYYDHLDFDTNSEAAARLRKILTKIERLLAHGNLPKMRGMMLCMRSFSSML